MTAVVDASSALLLAGRSSIPRDDLRRALEHLQERYTLAAPDMAAWEVGQFVYAKHPRLFGSNAAERAEVMESILAGIHLEAPAPGSLHRTGALATARGLTFYDASYLELADRDDVSVLITEDRALRKAAARTLGVGRAYDMASARKAIEAGEL